MFNKANVLLVDAGDAPIEEIGPPLRYWEKGPNSYRILVEAGGIVDVRG